MSEQRPVPGSSKKSGLLAKDVQKLCIPIRALTLKAKLCRNNVICNRTMIDVVQSLLDPRKNQRDWDEVLPYAMMAYRSSVQESTGETPYVMTYGGEEIMLPVDLFGVPENSEQDDELQMDCARKLRQRLRDAHNRARVVLQSAARRQKRNYDKKAVAKLRLV